MRKCGLFCSYGLGDGLIWMLVAHNLKKEGFTVVVFHDLLVQMQDWFEGITIEKFPDEKQVPTILGQLDLMIINYDDTKVNQVVRKEARNYRSYILMPSSRKQQHGDFIFNRDISMVENLMAFCRECLDITHPEKTNGLIPKSQLVHRKFPERVIIHPTSKSIDRNWSQWKFVKLARWLIKQKYQPVFIMSEEEKTNWRDQESFPHFKNLDDLSSYIYESGYCIGNDSGIGHLASSLQIPTLTIFCSKRKQALWKPDFYKNKGVVPWPLLPHIKGLRLRDKYWQCMVGRRRVQRAFKKITRTSV